MIRPFYLGHLEDEDTNQNNLINNHANHADHDPLQGGGGVGHLADATDDVHHTLGVHHVLSVKKIVHLLQLGKIQNIVNM